LLTATAVATRRCSRASSNATPGENHCHRGTKSALPAQLTIGSLELDPALVARLAAGYTVIAWRRDATARAATPPSVSIAPTVASACAAPIVISSFADDAMLASVTGGTDGVFASLREGGVHVACGLHSRAAVDRISGEHERRGQRFVAAPILIAGANGEVAAIVGGAADAAAEVRSVFDAVGVSIAVTCERPADAAVLAAAHSAMLASAMQAIAEAFTLVRKYGVDPAVIRDVMSETLFAGSVYPRLADAMLGRSADRAPTTARGLEIVGLALDLASTTHVPLPGVEACRDRLLSAIARGNGERPWTAVAEEQARAAGLE
jgi:3-hydroxyisobutyrate dehydrogenase-like beta-hydroxyacid dehydrogenase